MFGESAMSDQDPSVAFHPRVGVQGLVVGFTDAYADTGTQSVAPKDVLRRDGLGEARVPWEHAAAHDIKGPDRPIEGSAVLGGERPPRRASHRTKDHS